MSSTMAPNVGGVGAPGRRTVYSMCSMCSVRCMKPKHEIETNHQKLFAFINQPISQ